MNNENNNQKFCPGCEEYSDAKVVERNDTYKVRDREITVPVKVEICAGCGETLGSDAGDQEILNAVHAEYRRLADLLTPEQIKSIRKRYALSQKSFAALLGMSEATINRYEQGALQDQVHDTAIRACEKNDMMRGLVERRGGRLSKWQRDRVEKVLDGAGGSESNNLDRFVEFDWISMPQEVTDRTGFRRFDYERFASVAAWFCNKWEQVSRTTINKLMFYADFLCFKTNTVSLTGAAYQRRQYGPVPANYDGLLSRMESEGILISREKEYPNGYMGFCYSVGPIVRSLNVEFTEQEQEVLEHVSRAFQGMTAKAISDKSHQESAWMKTEDKDFISFATAASLSLSLPQ